MSKNVPSCSTLMHYMCPTAQAKSTHQYECTKFNMTKNNYVQQLYVL